MEKKLNGKEIAKILDESYSGIETLKYQKRYENGDNQKKMIDWVLGNFNTSYGIARRIVIFANNFSEWFGYYSN